MNKIVILMLSFALFAGVAFGQNNYAENRKKLKSTFISVIGKNASLSKSFSEYEAKSKKKDMDGALAELDKMIKADSKLYMAYDLRGNLKFKQKDYEGAIKDYTVVLAQYPNEQTLFNRANAYSSNKDYAKAIADCDEVIENSPKDAGAYYNRAVAKHQSKDYAGAAIDFRKTIELDPTNLAAKNNLQVAEKKLGSSPTPTGSKGSSVATGGQNTKTGMSSSIEQTSQLDSLEHAVYVYEEFLKLNPENTDVVNQLARIRVQLGQQQAAIDDLSRIIKIRPADSKGYFDRARLKHNLKDYKGATEDYILGLKYDFKNAEAYYELGNISADQKQYAQAIDQYTKAIQFNANYADAYNARGEAKFEKSDFENALNDFQEALKINNRHQAAKANQLKVKKKMKEKDKVMEAMTILVELDKTNPVSYFNRAEALRNILDNAEGALEDYTEAIVLKPTYHEAYKGRALAKEGLGDIIGAIEDYTDYIKIKPKDANGYYWRALAKQKVNFKDGWMQDLNKCIELDKDYADAYYLRAELRIKDLPEFKANDSKKNKDAFYLAYNPILGDLNMYAKLKPRETKVLMERAELKRQVRDFNGAIKDYTIAIDIDDELAEAYYQRSMVNIYSLGKKDEACADLKKAKTLGHDDARKRYDLDCK